MTANTNGTAKNGHMNGTAKNGAANNGHADGEAKPGGGREADGRFGTGNAGGPGNPYARQTAALRKAAAEAATPEKIRAMMDGLYERGMAGDTAAARLWMSYTAGKAGPGADPDAVDAHELRLRREAVATEADVKAMFCLVPASLICTLSHHVPADARARAGEAFFGPRPGGRGAPATDAGACAAATMEGVRVTEGLTRILGEEGAGDAPAGLLRGARCGLPGGVEEGNGRHVVPPADDKRRNGGGRRRADDGPLASDGAGRGTGRG